MKIIGLTGGTGSGKSTLAKIFKEYGALIIDADIIAREVVTKGSPCLKEIMSSFGNEILLNDGSLNRKKLGNIVFADREKLQLLNKITHKYILKEILEIIEKAKKQNIYNMIVVDAAVLIESGLNKICDIVIIVYADKESRLLRIMKRDGLKEDKAFERINSQMSFDDMKRYSDFIIKNDNNILEVKKQVIKIIEDIESSC